MSFAYLFPGQGCQTPNMTQWILKEYPVAKILFEQSSQALGYSLEETIQLQKSEYCQPAVLLTSYCYYRYIIDRFDFTPNYMCGHSLGEITALVAAGSIDLLEALKLVKFRGQLMDSVGIESSGGMLAVINFPLHDLDKRIEIFNIKIKTSFPLVISSFSSPKEFVISGPSSSLAIFQEELKKDHIISILLQVSCAFHHPVMANIKNEFSCKLNSLSIHKPKNNVLSATTEKLLKTPFDIKEALVKQIDSPVRWLTCIESILQNQHINFIVDVGPRTILHKTVKDTLAKQVFKSKQIELFSFYPESGRKQIETLKGKQQIKLLNNYLAQMACSKTKKTLTTNATNKIIESYSDIQDAISILKTQQQRCINNSKFSDCRSKFINAMTLKGYESIEV